MKMWQKLLVKMPKLSLALNKMGKYNKTWNKVEINWVIIVSK